MPRKSHNYLKLISKLHNSLPTFSIKPYLCELLKFNYETERFGLVFCNRFNTYFDIPVILYVGGKQPRKRYESQGRKAGKN